MGKIYMTPDFETKDILIGDIMNDSTIQDTEFEANEGGYGE